MFTNSSTLSFKTNNSPFEELHSLLTYRSSTSSVEKISFSKSDNLISYKGVLKCVVPLADRLGAPNEIDICINGFIKSDGTSETIITIPESYKEYIQAKEKIKISSNGDINVSLKYLIHCMNEEGIIGSMKSKAYNSVIKTVESHIMSLYTEKRKLCFCRNPKCDIKDLNTFLKHFSG